MVWNDILTIEFQFTYVREDKNSMEQLFYLFCSIFDKLIFDIFVGNAQDTFKKSFHLMDLFGRLQNTYKQFMDASNDSPKKIF